MKKDCRSRYHKDGHVLHQVEGGDGQPQMIPTAGSGGTGAAEQPSLGSLVSLNMIACQRPPTLQGRQVRIGVDSGAGCAVWPKQLCTDYPTVRTQRTGQQFASAGQGEKPIVNEGERTLEVRIGSEARSIRAQVAKVRKPLLAVSEWCAAGHDVHFLAGGGSYAIHKATGSITPIVQNNGIYELVVEVPPFMGGRR